MNINKSLLSKYDAIWLLTNKWENQFFTCLYVTKAEGGLDNLSWTTILVLHEKWDFFYTIPP